MCWLSSNNGSREGLVSNGVLAIMGADCSGVTGAIATNVAVPNGVVMISPSATSPGLTDLKDKGYFLEQLHQMLEVDSFSWYHKDRKVKVLLSLILIMTMEKV